MARKKKTETVQSTPVVDEVLVADESPSVGETPIVDKKVTLNTAKTIDELNEVIGDNANIAKIIIENYLIATSKHNDDKSHLVSAKYDLFNGIKNIINDKDYNTFKSNFDYINRVFIIKGEKDFNHVSLCMHDYIWNFGSDSKIAFQLTTKLISILANPKNRKTNKGKVNKIFKFYTDAGVANLSRYYGI